MSTTKNQPDILKNIPEEDEISLLDILQVIAENLRLLVAIPILFGLTALAISYYITPTFTADTKFLPPQQQQSAAASIMQSLGSLGSLAGATAGLKNPSDQYVAFLKTRSVQDALIQRFDLQKRYQQKYLGTTRNALEKNSNINAGKDNIITIQVDDKDPQTAADIANAYIEELSHLLNRLAVTEAQQRRLFFEKQLAETKNNLAEAEKALASSGVSAAALNANPTIALEGPARLRAQTTAQEVKLAAMRSYLTENAPEFKQALSELTALRAQLAKVEKSQAENQPASGNNNYINKYREYKYQETLYELFTRQFEVAKVDESREGATIQIIDAAIPPETKSRPKRALIATLTTIGSFLIILVAIFIRTAFTSTDKNSGKAEKIAMLRKSFRKSLWIQKK